MHAEYVPVARSRAFLRHRLTAFAFGLVLGVLFTLAVLS